MSELVGVCEVGERAFGLESENGGGCTLLVEVPQRRAEESCESITKARPSLVETGVT